MTETLTPGGTIWKTGTHDVSVNGKGTHLIAPEYSLKQYYNLMKRKIKEKGYIPIGIDHVSDTLLASNPVLKELLKEQGVDVHNVGKIYDVTRDGTEIKIGKSEITNPTIQKLYDEGKLNAWSVVSDIRGIQCPDKENTTIADYFKDIERVDFVGAGGCRACRVEDNPLETEVNGISSLNASYMEIDKMTKDPNVNDPIEPVVEPTEPVEPAANPVEPEPVEPTEPVEPEPKPEEAITKADLKDLKADIMGAVTQALSGQDQTVTAKLAKIEEDSKLEAKKVKVEAKINTKIKDGYILPAMKDGLLKASLATPEDEDVDKMLAGFNKKLWEGGQLTQNPAQTEDTIDIGAFRAGRKAGRF